MSNMIFNDVPFFPSAAIIDSPISIKGTIGDVQSGADINSLPTHEYVSGDAYRVVTAGTYAGVSCEPGDLIVAVHDGPATGFTVINSDWTVIQANIDGAVTTDDGALTNNKLIIGKGNKQVGSSNVDIDNVALKSELSTVATTGDYDDLLNKPAATIIFNDPSQVIVAPREDGSATSFTLAPNAEQQAILEDDRYLIIKIDLSAFSASIPSLVPYVWLKKNVKQVLSPVTGVNITVNQYSFDDAGFNYDTVTQGYIPMIRVGNGCAIYNVTPFPSALSQIEHLLFISFENFNVDVALNRITSLENTRSTATNLLNGQGTSSLLQVKSKDYFTIDNPYTQRTGTVIVAAEGGDAAVFNGASRTEDSYATAFGIDNISAGFGSFTEGNRNIVESTYGHAEGQANLVSGNNGHAQGQENLVEHVNASAGGYKNKTGKSAQSVVGQYNKVNSVAYFVVGNGTGENDRKNALEVNNDGTVTVGAGPINNLDVATKEYVDTYIEEFTNAEIDTIIAEVFV